jgi:hypothetical protein
VTIAFPGIGDRAGRLGTFEGGPENESGQHSKHAPGPEYDHDREHGIHAAPFMIPILPRCATTRNVVVRTDQNTSCSSGWFEMIDAARCAAALGGAA